MFIFVEIVFFIYFLKFVRNIDEKQLSSRHHVIERDKII